MRLSLKWRIQIWHILILSVLVGVLAVLFYFYEADRRLQQIDQNLDQAIPPLLQYSLEVRGVGPPLPDANWPGNKGPRIGSDRERRRELPPVPAEWINRSQKQGQEDPQEKANSDRPRDALAAFESRLAPLGYYVIGWDSSGRHLVFKSPNAPDIEFPGIHRRGYWLREVKDERRELFHRFPAGTILVGHYTADYEAEMAALRLELFLSAVGIVVLGALVGAICVSRSLRPLQHIRSKSRGIADGKLAERIESDTVEGTVEMEELSEDLNRTFAAFEKLMARQTMFTADASHELRTPLTALIAQIRRGQNPARSPEEYVAIFDICDRSADRLKRIVDNLLELSRYDSGRIELEREDLPLDRLMQELSEDFTPLVESKGGQIICDLQPCQVSCDPFRIEQVLANLINNAVKHNAQPVTITLRCRAEAGYARIEVEDDGVGIQPENLERLFDRFFQEAKSRTGNGVKGSSPNVGLGLSISKAIIEAHGGSIGVESKPGRRTIFSIRLPDS